MDVPEQGNGPQSDVPQGPSQSAERFEKALPSSRFMDFVDSTLQKVEPDVASIDPMVVKLSLMMRKLNQLMVDDASWRIHRPAGWTQASYRICFALWVAGSLPPHKVASTTNMSRATISAGLKRITRDGLITKVPSTEDLRSTVLQLTEKGEEAVRRTYLEHMQLEEAWLNPLSAPEKLMMLMLLEKIMSGQTALEAESRLERLP